MFRPLFLAVAIVTGVAAASAGADVVMLVHPKVPLDPDTKVEPFDCPALSAKNVPIVRGAAVRTAGLKAAGYVIEVPPPHTAVIATSGQFTVIGEMKPRRIEYTNLHILQPYKVWFQKEAGAAPALLGDGFQFLRASQISQISAERIEISKATVPELTQSAMRGMPAAIASDIAHALAAKIVVGAPVRDSYQHVQKVMPDPAAFGFVPQGDTPFFKPVKIVPDKTGEPFADVELHNRLPSRVSGKLQSQALFVNSVRLLAMRTDGAADFDLKPGEKTVLKFPATIRASLKSAQWTVEVTGLKIHD